MTLAEALLHRADLQKKLASLKQRLSENVKVQDGDLPSEDPQALLAAAHQVIEQLYQLIAQIHRTNAQALLANGQTMLTMLIERDALAERHRLVQSAIDHAKTESDRYSLREIKWQKTVNITALQQQADDIAAQLRQLNIDIQAANWQIKLIDA